MARAGSSPYEAKQRRKQGYLASLAKLDDRDTQGAAVAELQTALKAGTSRLDVCFDRPTCLVGRRSGEAGRPENATARRFVSLRL